ncbi:MAG TPA: DUF116 domain-containing protein [Burkholderiales bacterium]|nr:DUF116 domain-containing protein [Burkholderiales bacterium]
MPGPDAGPREVRAALERGLASVLGLRLRRADGEIEVQLPSRAEETERSLACALDWSRQGEGLLEAVWKGGGATLRARGGFTDGGRRFAQVELAGDMHLAAPEWLAELEAGLAGLPAGLARRRVEEFCRERPLDAVGVGAADLARVLELLADKHSASASLGLNTTQANALMLQAAEGEGGAREVLERATVMLVPYCAKPAWCKWRHLDGCAECGLCEVGEAYRLARERGMEVNTVTRYEHLVSTLGEMRRRGTPAYVGMCCSNFFIKRHRAFQQAGIPALLMDISGSNCYELKQEDQAYAGTFKAEAKLDLEVLRKVMRFVPARVAAPPPADDGSHDPRAEALEEGTPGG